MKSAAKNAKNVSRTVKVVLINRDNDMIEVDMDERVLGVGAIVRGGNDTRVFVWDGRNAFCIRDAYTFREVPALLTNRIMEDEDEMDSW